MALGVVIAVIVESIIGTGGGGSPMQELPPDKGGLKEWIKTK